MTNVLSWLWAIGQVCIILAIIHSLASWVAKKELERKPTRVRSFSKPKPTVFDGSEYPLPNGNGTNGYSNGNGHFH